MSRGDEAVLPDLEIGEPLDEETLNGLSNPALIPVKFDPATVRRITIGHGVTEGADAHQPITQALQLLDLDHEPD